MAKFKNLAVGALIAGAAGYVAGLLTAPKSGRATREDIKNATDSTISETERQLKKLHTELNELLGEAKSRGNKVQGQAKDEYDEVTAFATKTKQKAREIISAIHEGETDNKELQRVMLDTQKAVNHLKTYLKK
ncbi:MAG TPA: YtxH domain-containing protein [Candidatus Saccharimonadales bacterium]|nr:YtxH domain-containing protein [Candidatus Saccharimonadales bacterium]